MGGYWGSSCEVLGQAVYLWDFFEVFVCRVPSVLSCVSIDSAVLSIPPSRGDLRELSSENKR